MRGGLKVCGDWNGFKKMKDRLTLQSKYVSWQKGRGLVMIIVFEKGRWYRI